MTTLFRFICPSEVVELRAASELEAWDRFAAVRPGVEVLLLRRQPDAVRQARLMVAGGDREPKLGAVA